MEIMNRFALHLYVHYMYIILYLYTFRKLVLIIDDRNALKYSRKRGKSLVRKGMSNLFGNLVGANLPGQLRILVSLRLYDEELTKFIKRHKEEFLILFSCRLLDDV